MIDNKCAKAFLDNQLKLYPETVVTSVEEAKEFLEDSMAVVADSARDVRDYLDDVGVDTDGLSKDELLNIPEVFAVGDGRFLILEI